MRSIIAVVVVFSLSAVAIADDRSSCDHGDKQACARIGRLKQLGAAKADGSRDTDALIAACSKAVGAATAPSAFGNVARACGQLYNPELQKAWDALSGVDGGGIDAMLGTGYAEAYCPKLAKPVTGCKGKKAASFDSLKPEQVRAALSALNAAALEIEIGADKAKPLAAMFDRAWEHLFAK
jgi:hypothetical protein